MTLLCFLLIHIPHTMKNRRATSDTMHIKAINSVLWSPEYDESPEDMFVATNIASRSNVDKNVFK